MQHRKSAVEELLETQDGRREFAKEELAVEATEVISELMQKEKVSKSELAKRIGKSKSYVTQLLSGSRNMTMHTFAEMLFALEYKAQLRAVPMNNMECVQVSWQIDNLTFMNEPPRQQRGGSAQWVA